MTELKNIYSCLTVVFITLGVFEKGIVTAGLVMFVLPSVCSHGRTLHPTETSYIFNVLDFAEI
jgi:hypothetical protein